MKDLTRRVERFAQRRFPAVYYHLVQRPRTHFRFRTERLLASGASLSTSVHPSVLFFTTHKCASRYVQRIISALVEPEGMPTVDYDAYLTMAPIPKQERIFTSQHVTKRAFSPAGYFYGPFGSWRPVPDSDKYRVFLQLRDPRDVLTSLYFSTAHSHALINRKMLIRRREALEMTIDEYVLQMAPQYVAIYSSYCEKLLDAPGTLFLKYEHMVADFPGWLSALSTHLALDHHSEVIERLVREANFSVDEEDKFSHRRQVTPGDHLRKLLPQTVEALDLAFAPVLQKLGY